jgi:signal peptidase I
VSESVPDWDPDDASPEFGDEPNPFPGDARPPVGDPTGEGPADRLGEGPDAIDRMREDARESREKSESRRSFWRELPILVLVALVVAILIKTFLIQAFFIPSASMRDTLLEGDRVMVNKLAYRFGDPSRGDVVVFDSPLEPDTGGENFFGSVVRHVTESLGLSSPDSALIKRVIAVGGETIEIRDNRVLIDGVAIDEPYLRPGTRMPDFGPETVPDDELFVMGDNRGASQDSRRFGTVREDTVIGRAFVRVWPPSRWGGL